MLHIPSDGASQKLYSCLEVVCFRSVRHLFHRRLSAYANSRKMSMLTFSSP